MKKSYKNSVAEFQLIEQFWLQLYIISYQKRIKLKILMRRSEATHMENRNQRLFLNSSYLYWFTVGNLGLYSFFSSMIYRQTYRDFFCFSFTHDCFRANNNTYVPFYKRHTKNRKFICILCMYFWSSSLLFLTSESWKETILISFPWNFWHDSQWHFFHCDFPIYW